MVLVLFAAGGDEERPVLLVKEVLVLSATALLFLCRAALTVIGAPGTVSTTAGVFVDESQSGVAAASTSDLVSLLKLY